MLEQPMAAKQFEDASSVNQSDHLELLMILDAMATTVV
jgi:hypothetical protein